MVEMMVALATGAVLLGLCLSVLHRTLQAESASRDLRRFQHTAQQLTTMLRRDVQEAVTANLQSPPSGGTSLLQLEYARRLPVTWTIDVNSLVRTEVLADERVAREKYQFPATYRAHASLVPSPRRVVLQLTRGHASPGAPTLTDMRLELVVGKLAQLNLTTETPQ
jgi:hypothetical protein